MFLRYCICISIVLCISIFLCICVKESEMCTVHSHWPGCSIQQQFKKFNAGNIPEPPSSLLLYHIVYNIVYIVYNTIQNYTITYNSIQYHTIPYNTPIPCCTIQYSSLPPFVVLYSMPNNIFHIIFYHTIFFYTMFYHTLFYHTIFSLPPSRSTIQCTISAATPFLKFNLPIS